MANVKSDYETPVAFQHIKTLEDAISNDPLITGRRRQSIEEVEDKLTKAKTRYEMLNQRRNSLDQSIAKKPEERIAEVFGVLTSDHSPIREDPGSPDERHAKRM